MRRAARTDQNHAAIVEAFRAHGWSVQSLAAIGKGCPDLLVGKYGRDHVVEVKTVKGKLTDDEAKWIDAWRGTVFIVRTVADVARFNSEAIAALAPSANRFDCPQCGQGIAVDEDGCCRSCGADAKAVTADRAAAAPAPEGPTDDEVNAGIDSLAEQAKRRITGSSGHAWGARAAIDRQAERLKDAIADRTAAAPAPQQQYNTPCWTTNGELVTPAAAPAPKHDRHEPFPYMLPGETLAQARKRQEADPYPAAAPAPKHHKTGEPLPGWDRAAAPAPDGLDKLRQRVSDYLPNAGESLAKRLVMDLVAEVERLELRRLQLETANSEIAEANDERPVLSDEVLRAMAEEWQADIKQDCELGYINPGLVAFARAVLARQQAER